MKKYVYEAFKKQLEKPTEPNCVFNATARTTVLASDESEAKILAEDKLAEEYAGTGIVLGEALLVSVSELPVDWSYGYDEERRSGPTETIGDLVGNNVIK